MSEAKKPVLEVRNLSVTLPKGADREFAVDKVSFTVNPGEIVCLVGESGSGKSVIAFTVMGLLAKALKPSSGEILLEGENILAASEDRLRELRCTRMSMIFQEPMTALNPVMTCGDQIDEVLNTHTNLDAAQRRAKIIAILERVKLPEPERIYASFPHQLSGGQRQRIMIAMALVLDPVLLIADEPTTALDVTTQAEILKLIAELQDDRGHRRAVHHPRFRRRRRDRPSRRRAALGRAGGDGADRADPVAARARLHQDADLLGAVDPSAAPRRAQGGHHRPAHREARQDLQRQRLLPEGARREGRGRRRPRHPQGRDPGHRGRIGLGQVDGGALHRPPDRSDRGQGVPGRHRDRHHDGRQAASASPQGADRLPGSLSLDESAHHGGRVRSSRGR